MTAVAGLLCCPCPSEPIDCDSLPTALVVAWSGAFEVLFFACPECEGLYIAGEVSAPSFITATATLNVFTPGNCVYAGEALQTQENTVDQRTCEPDESVGACVIVTETSIGPPYIAISGPAAGRWAVNVTLRFVSSTCDGALYSCSCPFFTNQTVVFAGPLASLSPIGGYAPVAGSSWAGVFFPCDGSSITTEVVGSVTVS